MPSRLRTLTSIAAATGLALGSLAFARPPVEAFAAAAFHLRLVKSEPAKGDSVSAPKVLRLWFSEPATLAVTSVKLKAADDSEVALAKPTFSGDEKQPVEVAVTGTLSRGTYTVSFKTASRDMHPVTGDYSFVVR